LEAPEAETEPEAQGSHLSPELENVPAEQGVHLPLTGAEPAEHLSLSHEDWPVLPLVVVPEAHLVHEAAPDDEKVSAGQAEQAAPPLLNVPAAQVWHLPLTLVEPSEQMGSGVEQPRLQK
jgi:hypothetical protein